MPATVVHLANSATRSVANPTHPYYPLDAKIIDYAPNERSVPAILAVFIGACTILFSSTYLLLKRIQPPLNKQELSTIMWFILSGAIHVFFEGYYVVNHATLGSKQTLLGQLWKEYALSDSRYLTNNSLVLCMETVTAVLWGPSCFVVAGLVVTRNPLRYPLQMIVSMAHFYGDAIYYATAFFDHYVNGVPYSRPEAVYFWGYFVVMNIFWILIPGMLIYQSTIKAANAIATVERLQRSKKFE